MLDVETRRRIDTARDILVGKVPDPKSQVEQITIALIYKFMWDIEARSEELGGQRRFFVDDFERFAWPKLLRSGLGGFETLSLYSEALDRIPENPGIPPLFRSIFNNAYLPYRDPETLREFLKVIDQFEYDHSERLGDAFEYLLSIMGAQGDAGQFRTPRHIIDFIVEIVNPQLYETVLDPACGTAGFLISAYKHIQRANSDADGKSTLTPHERGRLAESFTGYDISPDMVRLSLVNMYLHGFVQPDIHEYDTLTSEERWDEYADVILANPPFMSPKGGIRPHSRFSVQSRRSEVLFADYMAEHLTPGGRAGIIVPEGIIFQNQRAHTQLRKMLVEDYLVAVVSLPAGIFKPYSGVKTSILFLDRTLAGHTKHVAFFKVENDGFDLGDQRLPIAWNDLPKVKANLVEYMRRVRDGDSLEGSVTSHGLVVEKDRIAAGDDYNLTADRYRDSEARTSAFDLHSFESVCTLEYGKSLPRKSRVDGPYPVMGSNGISGYHNQYLIEGPAIIVGRKGSAGEVTYVESNCFPIDTTYFVKLASPDQTNLMYIYHLLKSLDLRSLRGGAGIPGLNRSDVYAKYMLPLPPLEVQQEIAAEIDGYQKVIAGSRAVIDNYRPRVPIDPDWPLVEIGELCSVERGASPRPIRDFITDSPDGVNWVKIGDAEIGSKFITSTKDRITTEGAKKSRPVKPGDFILSNSMSFGRPYIMSIEGCIHDGWLLLRGQTHRIHQDYLYYILCSDYVFSQFKRAATGGVVNNLNSRIVKSVRIPLPNIELQAEIAKELDSERSIVDANRGLIEIFERKGQDAIERVWITERSRLEA